MSGQKMPRGKCASVGAQLATLPQTALVPQSLASFLHFTKFFLIWESFAETFAQNQAASRETT